MTKSYNFEVVEAAMPWIPPELHELLVARDKAGQKKYGGGYTYESFYGGQWDAEAVEEIIDAVSYLTINIIAKPQSSKTHLRKVAREDLSRALHVLVVGG